MKSYFTSQDIFDIALGASGISLLLGAFFIFRSAEFKELLIFIEDYFFKKKNLRNERSMLVSPVISSDEEERYINCENIFLNQTVSQSFVSVKSINQRKINFNLFDKIRGQIDSAGGSLQENLKYTAFCA